MSGKTFSSAILNFPQVAKHNYDSKHGSQHFFLIFSRVFLNHHPRLNSFPDLSRSCLVKFERHQAFDKTPFWTALPNIDIA